MKYIVLNENKVSEIIPEYVDIFPNIPANKRYSADFLSKCVAIDDDATVELDMVYDEDTNTFNLPTVEEEPNQPIDETMSEEHKTYADKLAELEEENASLKEQITSLEDCILEIADVIYA